MTAPIQQVDMASILQFMHTQKEVIQQQKETLHSQSQCLRSQAIQIKKQIVLIEKLTKDCDSIGKNALIIAKKVADEEVEKFKKTYVADVTNLSARVKVIDAENHDLTSLAICTTAVAVVCVALVVCPYVIVLV